MNQLDKIQQIIRDVLDRPDLEINSNDGQETVEGWDSLASINIMSAVAADYEMTFTIDDFPKFTSVESILSLVGAEA
ncbi:acyl carrier protein [Roseibium sp. SCPC15]|uniref:acyl carrier protein n=1 Tax=Roseibium sp. SCP15 TaxID=3141376 RepID=UPI0033360682